MLYNLQTLEPDMLDLEFDSTVKFADSLHHLHLPHSYVLVNHQLTINIGLMSS